MSAPVINERRDRTRSRFVMRWDAVITVVVALVVGIVIGMGVQFAVDHADPWNGVPWCTDAIADAGGICHGEPVADAPVGIPTSAPIAAAVDPSPIADAPVINEDPAPWLIADDGTQHFEDGSWLDADGTQGCTVGMPCDDLPPAPADAPMTPNGGYFPTLTLPPCPVEDSDNCYWDAELRGNGTGRSFIVVEGNYYYKEMGK